MKAVNHTSPPRIFSAILSMAIMTSTLAAGCSSGQRAISYKQSFTSAVASREAPRSPVKIDRYAAYTAYFRLERPVKSIRIGITAEYIADIAGTRKPRKTYFIIEKMIDTAHFKNKNVKDIFTELGRNFETDWTRTREIEVNSVNNNLFRSLDEKSVYRIRYTAFLNEDLDFIIKVEADCGVTFVNEPGLK